jgi:hypothetical protein
MCNTCALVLSMTKSKIGFFCSQVAEKQRRSRLKLAVNSDGQVAEVTGGAAIGIMPEGEFGTAEQHASQGHATGWASDLGKRTKS